MLITETNTNNLKQGDKSTLSYICLTDTNLSGQSAKAVLKTRQNAVVYTTDTTVQDGNVVDFTIDTVLPVGRYILEIVVNDEFIYPDDNTIYLNVTASSLGAVVDSIETNSLDMVKGYIKNILADIETAFTKEKADSLYQPKGDYAERSELTEYAKSEDLQGYAHASDLEEYAKDSELTEYAKREELDKYALASDLQGYATHSDLSPYATKDYVDSLDVTDQLGEYAKQSDLQGYATKQDIARFITENKMMMYVDSKFFDIERKGYVKKEYVDEQIDKLSQSLKEELASTTEEPAFVPDLTGLLSFNEFKNGTTIFTYSDGGGTLFFDLGNNRYGSSYKPKYISKNGKFIDISDKIDYKGEDGGKFRVRFKGLDKSQIDFMTEGITNTYTNPNIAFMTEQRLGVTLYAEK